MVEADVRSKYPEALGARRTDINLDRAKMNGWELGRQARRQVLSYYHCGKVAGTADGAIRLSNSA